MAVVIFPASCSWFPVLFAFHIWVLKWWWSDVWRRLLMLKAWSLKAFTPLRFVTGFQCLQHLVKALTCTGHAAENPSAVFSLWSCRAASCWWHQKQLQHFLQQTCKLQPWWGRWAWTRHWRCPRSPYRANQKDPLSVCQNRPPIIWM